MAQTQNFDPGYFGPKGDPGLTDAPLRERYYRKAGFDAGSILWPLVFLFVHLAMTLLVQLPLLIVRLMQMPGGLMRILEDPSSTQAARWMASLMYQDFLPSAIIYSLLQIIIYVLFLRFRAKRERYYVFTGRPAVLDLISGFFMSFIGLLLAVAWLKFLDFLSVRSSFWKNALNSYAELSSGAFTSDNIPLLIVAVAILVPVAEELLFRGIIMAELRRIMPTWLAVIINALLFAVFHGNLVQGVYVFLTGLVIALAYVWSESILVPIIMHITYNFCGSALQLIVGNSESGQLILSVVESAFAIIGLVLAVFFYLRRRNRRHKPESIVLSDAGAVQTSEMTGH